MYDLEAQVAIQPLGCRQRYLKPARIALICVTVSLGTAKLIASNRGKVLLSNVLDWIVGVPLEIMYVTRFSSYNIGNHLNLFDT